MTAQGHLPTRDTVADGPDTLLDRRRSRRPRVRNVSMPEWDWSRHNTRCDGRPVRQPSKRPSKPAFCVAHDTCSREIPAVEVVREVGDSPIPSQPGAHTRARGAAHSTAMLLLVVLVMLAAEAAGFVGAMWLMRGGKTPAGPVNPPTMLNPSAPSWVCR